MTEALNDPVQFWAVVASMAAVVALLVAIRLARVRSRRELRQRLEAQRAAEHARRLADVMAALGRARSEGAVVETSVQEPLHALRADAAMFLAVSDDQRSGVIMRAVAYDADAALAEQQEIGLDGPLGEAVRGRTIVVAESRRHVAAESAPDVVPLSYKAFAAVPLLAAGKVVALIRLDFRAPRTFNEDDRDFLTVLGRQAAQTLERARQYEAAQRAREEAEELRQRADLELEQRQKTEQALRSSETRYRALATRTTRLHALTAALSEAVTVDAVASAVVRHGNVVVGATSCSVALAATLAGEPGYCETDALRERQPIYVPSWDEARERYWRSAPVAADAAYVSSAALPLLVDSEPLGVLRFDFSVPVNFDPEYRALLVSVAQHCTQALDRARLYESAQKARTAAEDANRHKDEFLSIVSHELRTPLNAVLGWAAILQKGTSDRGLTTRAIQSIHDNASRQAKLIDDLLDVSRIVAGRATLDLQEIDVSVLIAGVVESFIPVAATQDVDLQLSPIPHAIVRADARRLEQVFFNLLANGFKFTEEGGRIDIDAAVVDGQIEVRVRDTGIGIEPEFLPYVFEAFRQGDSGATRNYGGLGLGLSIAKQLVDLHKGSMSVDSQGRGRGSTFLVRLPVVRVTAPVPHPAADARRREAPPRLDGVQVLAVDDEPSAREIVEIALEERGASVTAVRSAAEAFDRLLHGSFDVLLADIAMPDEDGCSLLRQIRACGDARAASIPAAAVTAHGREEERRAVLDAGFQLHLVKPIEPAELARAVERLARGPHALM